MEPHYFPVFTGVPLPLPTKRSKKRRGAGEIGLGSGTPLFPGVYRGSTATAMYNDVKIESAT